MKKKSVISIALAMCLVAGCGNSGTDKPETTLASTDATTTEPTTSTKANISNDQTSSELTETASNDTKDEKATATNATAFSTTYDASKNMTPEVIDENGQIKSIYFYRGDLKIYSKLYLPEGEGPFPVVILASGLGASYTSTLSHAETFSKNGIAAISFDYIGGVSPSNSDGNVTDKSVITEAYDIEAIIDGLANFSNLDTGNVFLWGHSLGGLASTYAATDRPNEVQGLIAVEPSYQMHDQVREFFPEPDELPDVITTPVYAGKQYITDLYAFNIYDEIPRYTGSAIIFAGTVAPSIGAESPEYLEKAVPLFKSANIEYIEGANHGFENEPKEKMLESTIKFIQENMSKE